MSYNYSQSQASTSRLVQCPGLVPNLAINDDMLTLSDNDEDKDGRNLRELRNLRRQATITQQQMASMQDIINQLLSQLIATLNKKKSITKPKIAAPKKFDGTYTKLQIFLTNINLYCEYNRVLTDQDKILIISTYIKGRAAKQIEPYVKDFLKDVDNLGTKSKT